MRNIAIDQKFHETPHPTVENVQTDNPTPISLKGFWLFAKEANIGEAIRSPTINADDKTPSWKLFKLKAP
jgi:hypothetical protein